jgi:hypothetical protein
MWNGLTYCSLTEEDEHTGVWKEAMKAALYKGPSRHWVKKTMKYLNPEAGARRIR